MHMENARRMYQVRSPTTSQTQTRRRSSTASPKQTNASSGSTSEPTPTPAGHDIAGDSDPDVKQLLNTSKSQNDEHIRKNKRLSEVSHRMEELKRRTSSKVAEIESITAGCNSDVYPTVSTGAIPKTSASISFETATPMVAFASTTTVKREEHQTDNDHYQIEPLRSFTPRLSTDSGDYPTAATPTPSLRSSVSSLRRKSSEESNSIVSILKKGEYSPGGAVEPHSILKKKDNSTPSDSCFTKHVSISEAVILAAAELHKDSTGSSPSLSGDSEMVIRPILKQDTPTISAPRPILKKKYSFEMEEIRPILKGSRKSSREESDNDTDSYRSYRSRNDSPAKRRSFCVDAFETNVVLERSRSYDVDCRANQNVARGQSPDARRFSVNEPLTPQLVIEKPLISVAERIKHMERALGSVDSAGSGASACGSEAVRRQQRFKTQPVTVEEIHW